MLQLCHPLPLIPAGRSREGRPHPQNEWLEQRARQRKGCLRVSSGPPSFQDQPNSVQSLFPLTESPAHRQ